MPGSIRLCHADGMGGVRVWWCECVWVVGGVQGGCGFDGVGLSQARSSQVR